MPLPWTSPSPLMLAPMQGLSNRAMRRVFVDTVAPDVVFTEFVRVRPQAKTLVAASDWEEATATAGTTPLVVQVIGSADDGVVEAVQGLVERGVEHINVNMGCPWGRMTSVLSGGGMFRYPQTIAPLLESLRAIVPGSLSVKTRAGLEDPSEILPLLPAFENAGVDFIIVHPRTVAQKYKGMADHRLTGRIVEATSMAVVANGDLRTAEDVERVTTTTKAHGAMLGRGAIADPWLFERVSAARRGDVVAPPTGAAYRQRLARHYLRLLAAFDSLFCGDAQILAKLREHLAHVEAEDCRKWIKSLKKAKRLDHVVGLLEETSDIGD